MYIIWLFWHFLNKEQPQVYTYWQQSDPGQQTVPACSGDTDLRVWHKLFNFMFCDDREDGTAAEEQILPIYSVTKWKLKKYAL